MKISKGKFLCLLSLLAALSGALVGCAKSDSAAPTTPSDVQQFMTTLKSMPETQRGPYLRAYPALAQQAMNSSDPKVQAEFRQLVPKAGNPTP